MATRLPWLVASRLLNVWTNDLFLRTPLPLLGCINHQRIAGTLQEKDSSTINARSVSASSRTGASKLIPMLPRKSIRNFDILFSSLCFCIWNAIAEKKQLPSPYISTTSHPLAFTNVLTDESCIND